MARAGLSGALPVRQKPCVCSAPRGFFAAGPPQGKKTPPRGAASRKRGVGAFFAAGPPQGKKHPLGGQQAEGAAWGHFLLGESLGGGHAAPALSRQYCAIPCILRHHD